MRKLLPLALLALAGCNTTPMTPEQRAFLLQHMQAQQAQTNQNLRDIANSQPGYQIVQPQPIQPTLQYQAPLLTGPKTTYCRKSYGAQQVECTTY